MKHDDAQYPFVLDMVRRAIPKRDGMRIARERGELTGTNEERFIAGHKGTPKCFTDAQWASWREAAKMSRPSILHSYCEDYTPQYRDRMLVSGRCAFPNTHFVGGYGFRVFWIETDV